MFCSFQFFVLHVERMPFLDGNHRRVHLQRFNVLRVVALVVVPDISEDTVVPISDGAQCLVVALDALVE